MRNRSLIIAAAITLGLLVTGIAWASQDSRSGSDDSASDDSALAVGGADDSAAATTSTSITSTTATTQASTTVTGSGSVSVGSEGVEYPIADAGSVTVRRDGDVLTVVSTRANSGWVVEVEVGRGREVEGDFRSGARRVRWNFELEDGVVRVRVEAENSTTASTSPTNVTTASTPTTTGLAIPNGPVTYRLDEAGTVTVLFADNAMSIGAINPAAGWTVASSEQHGDEIEVELRNGEQEVELKVEIEGGQVRVAVEHKS
ncbi:MAG TPA: hypothetical protein VLA54_00900 [Acidimicrobiia bacterium]|nr:hypothetical protein [Acidimicrobiia bacterium]